MQICPVPRTIVFRELDGSEITRYDATPENLPDPGLHAYIGIRRTPRIVRRVVVTTTEAIIYVEPRVVVEIEPPVETMPRLPELTIRLRLTCNLEPDGDGDGCPICSDWPLTDCLPPCCRVEALRDQAREAAARSRVDATVYHLPAGIHAITGGPQPPPLPGDVVAVPGQSDLFQVRDIDVDRQHRPYFAPTTTLHIHLDALPRCRP